MALTRLGLNQSINLASNVTGTLATGNGGTGATSFAPGKVGQVLQSANEGETNVTSDSYTGISLSQAITPSATSSKVMIIVSLEGVGHHSGCEGGALRITKGGSELKQFTISSGYDNNTSANFYGSADTCVFIDSPNTTSATTFAVEAKRLNSAGAWRMNSDSGASGNSYSSITVMEILA